jgi:hypothetical protein
MYALAIRLFGRDPNDNAKPVLSIGRWALLFQLASWSYLPLKPPPHPLQNSTASRFNFYALVRTFSNSVEATLTIVCLYRPLLLRIVALAFMPATP